MQQQCEGLFMDICRLNAAPVRIVKIVLFETPKQGQTKYIFFPIFFMSFN